ncbi:hypothetical protein IJ818_00285 [bacterium]|nr:hypothetical protein [bacterium]
MGTPIRKTSGSATTTVASQTSKPAKSTAGQGTSKSNTQKAEQSQSAQAKPKQKHYSVGADGRKVDVTSVFDQIEANTQQDLKDHDKFMQDMFGDVLN